MPDYSRSSGVDFNSLYNICTSQGSKKFFWVFIGFVCLYGLNAIAQQVSPLGTAGLGRILLVLFGDELNREEFYAGIGRLCFSTAWAPSRQAAVFGS
jgi:hypothetical protein